MVYFLLEKRHGCIFCCYIEQGFENGGKISPTDLNIDLDWD